MSKMKKMQLNHKSALQNIEWLLNVLNRLAFVCGVHVHLAIYVTFHEGFNSTL